VNRAQRIVVLATSCLMAVALFLGSGPFSNNADHPWNPLSSRNVLGVARWWIEDPLFGAALPIALVGLGLFVWFGGPKGGSRA